MCGLSYISFLICLLSACQGMLVSDRSVSIIIRYYLNLVCARVMLSVERALDVYRQALEEPRLLTLVEASLLIPYSQEYLSLLARRGLSGPSRGGGTGASLGRTWRDTCARGELGVVVFGVLCAVCGWGPPLLGCLGVGGFFLFLLCFCLVFGFCFVGLGVVLLLFWCGFAWGVWVFVGVWFMWCGRLGCWVGAVLFRWRRLRGRRVYRRGFRVGGRGLCGLSWLVCSVVCRARRGGCFDGRGLDVSWGVDGNDPFLCLFEIGVASLFL